jgi:hypothetical protein
VCNSRNTQEIGKRLRLYVCDDCARSLITMHFTGLEFGVPGGPVIQPEKLQVGIPGMPQAQVQRTLTIKEQIRQRDGDRCRYCYSPHPPLTLDHVIPKCQGGKGGLVNLVLACKACNLEKGGRTPEEAGMPLLEPYPLVAGVDAVAEQARQAASLAQQRFQENRRMLEKAGVLIPPRIECRRCERADLDPEQGVCPACVQQRAFLNTLDRQSPNGVIV